MLGASQPAGRRIAVLGEMLELGDQAVALHEACGRHAAAAGVQRLVTVGGEPARRLGEAAIAAGSRRAQVTPRRDQRRGRRARRRASSAPAISCS